MRIGLHVSRHGGTLTETMQRAADLGADTLQIFSSSPRMWRASKLSQIDISGMRRVREKHDIGPLVIHDSYLINLAARPGAVRSSSVAAFRGEIERGLAIGADYLVAHPGNGKGQSLEEGLLAVVDGLVESAAGIRSESFMILLENTVGAGGQLGSRFEELEVIRRLAQERTEIPIGFCLDTCHCFASGNYDVSTGEGLKETISAVETVLGLDRVRVFHTNDSKGEKGSRLDRHANIGDGRIGAEAFGRILNHPKLREKAFILETPVLTDQDPQRDLATLRSLVKNRRRQ